MSAIEIFIVVCRGFTLWLEHQASDLFYSQYEFIGFKDIAIVISPSICTFSMFSAYPIYIFLRVDGG